MYEYERIRSLPREEKTWKRLKKPWGTKIGVRWDSLGEKTEKYWGRDRTKWGSDRTRSLNSASVNLDRWRCQDICRGRCRENGRQQLRYRWGVEEQPNRNKNRSSIDPSGVKKLSRMQNHFRSIHQLSRSCWDCDKKKLKKLDRQQGIEEASSQLFKKFFQEEKNTDINAIQHATQPMIQSTC